MGSPNFLGVDQLEYPSVGIDIDYFMRGVNSDEYSNYRTRLDQKMDKIYRHITSVIDEANESLFLHRLKVNVGYHSGFQIVLESYADVEEIIATTEVEVEADDIEEALMRATFLMHTEKGEEIHELSSFIHEGFIVEEQLEDLFKLIEYDGSSRSGFSNIKAELYEDSIEKIMYCDAQEGLNIMAGLARNHDLRLITGSGYTVGVTRSDVLNEDTLRQMEIKAIRPVSISKPKTRPLRPRM